MVLGCSAKNRACTGKDCNSSLFRLLTDKHIPNPNILEKNHTIKRKSG
jgi:hypothetical protein